ncbi:annexin A2 isoform X2 [Denticeps clupeoides]|uniref:annexin A2 isoform X2 n=1 Tax=Denticeps clupeoides TaxID=299321 RepID=UPI0010A42E6C|nr:annexin A2-like isoform X2 [Denticeps clupeoides]
MGAEISKPEDMSWGTLGSLRPSPNFQAGRDVERIQDALAQKDAGSLVRILTNRNNAQRQDIMRIFSSATQKDLKAELKTVVSGDLETLMLNLMMTPEQFDAQRLRRAMEGLGTDEETVLEVLCTRTPEQLRKVTAAYKTQYNRDLEKDLISETSGDFTKLLLALLKEYGKGNIDQDVNHLSKELSNKKSDSAPWIEILTTKNPQHLANVMDTLEAERDQRVDEALQKHFGGLLSGDLKLGLKTLVRWVQNPGVYLAQRLQSMKGGVVQDVLVSHCEEDLLRIRVAYLKETGTSLYSSLQKHFKGDVQTVLLALCGAED